MRSSKRHVDVNIVPSHYLCSVNNSIHNGVLHDSSSRCFDKEGEKAKVSSVLFGETLLVSFNDFESVAHIALLECCEESIGVLHLLESFGRFESDRGERFFGVFSFGGGS